jgi:hypothetical protein
MAGPSLARNRFAPPAGGSGGGIAGVVVQDNGAVVVPAATQLNFIGFTVALGGPGQADITFPGASSEQVEYHTVTALELAAKQFNLGSAPITPANVQADVVDGAVLGFSTDFSVVGSVFSWNGLGLDGVIAEGDVVRLVYFA